MEDRLKDVVESMVDRWMEDRWCFRRCFLGVVCHVCVFVCYLGVCLCGELARSVGEGVKEVVGVVVGVASLGLATEEGW